MKKTSLFTNGLIWFGAAISIAEIITGTIFAPLGLTKGISAILVGHLIGFILMFATGYIGASTEKSAMETVKMSFGQSGSLFFSSLNILQLIGWTAVMIVSGAAAAHSILTLFGPNVWALIIGALIILWVYIGLKNLNKINILAMGALFILTIILSGIIFKGDLSFVQTEGLSFGAAVELAVAMPLSWLPLISDYTRKAKDKKRGPLVSAITYNIFSSWMYIIGLGAALFTQEADIAQIMLSAGLGMAGLLIIVLSTVTTTFLDVYSAGVSAVSIHHKLNEKHMAAGVAVLGTLLAIFTPITQMEHFLYLIGSVFAPMIAIQLANHYFVKYDASAKHFHWINIVLWLIGFAIYRSFMSFMTPIGITIPVIAIIMIISIITQKVIKPEERKDGKKIA